MTDRFDNDGSLPRIDAAMRVESETKSMLQAARQEQPDVDLAKRLLVDLANRKSQSTEIGQPTTSRKAISARGIVGLSCVAAAAVALLVTRARFTSPMAIAEPRPSVASSVGPATAAVANPPVDDPCRKRVVAKGKQPSIDDFEDGDDAVLAYESRSGLWRWVRDTDRPGTAPALLPIPQRLPTAKDRLALHVKGGSLQDWGATVEFTFQPACYDASAYHGISMRARGPGRIYLTAREVRLIPPEGGGTCQGHDCYNVHVKKFDLSSRYTTIEARWSELKQRGYHQPPIDPTQIHSIAVMVRPEDTPYDVWIDDVRFIDN
ncbi:MAG TPA: carbohydrate binding domain-containing protein [Polyangiaceae bacterium]